VAGNVTFETRFRLGYAVFTDEGSTVPAAVLKVNVTFPVAAPLAPLTSQVTVVPT
jgi:hypothetical protein